jgi:hypothetical protein
MGAASARKWRQENRERHLLSLRDYRVKNSDKLHLRRLKSKYGVSPATYRELFEMQGGRCAICQVTQDAIGSRLELDHCHATNQPRGLLCGPCNRSLGAHEKAGTNTYKRYLEWTPMMRLAKLKTLTDEERALWNW